VSRRTTWLVATTGVVAASLGVAGFVAFGGGSDDSPFTSPDDRPRRGGTLTIAAPDLTSLDPARARNPIEVMVADHLYDTLVTFDDDLDPAPGVAEGWEPSFDQQTFTFTLREGVTFHDGRPVTSADVKATLERISAPGSTSDFRFLLEDVTGYEAHHVEGQGGGLSGVTAPDPRTVVIELSEPFAQFPAVLGNPGFGIVPADAGADFGESPIGSGPMKFEGRDDDVIHLVANAAYEPDPAYIDGIDLVLSESTTEAYEALRDGVVDLAPVPADDVNAARDAYGDAGFGPLMAGVFYGMNTAAPDLADPRMRAAILAAVDRTRIVDLAYRSSVIVADGLVPSGIPGWVENACGDRCVHDPDRARSLVAEAFPDGSVPEITIDFDDDPVQALMAGAIEADLEAVGIPATLRPHAFGDYGPFLIQGDPELFRSGWTADYPSADAFLYPLFVSGQDDNLVRLDVESVDNLLREARAEPDPRERRARYREAEQLVLDQYPVVPVAQFTNRWAVGEEVRRFEMTPLGTFDVARLFLTRAPGSG